MSSSKGEPSHKIKWNKELMAKIKHVEQEEFKKLKEAAKGSKKKSAPAKKELTEK